MLLPPSMIIVIAASKLPMNQWLYEYTGICDMTRGKSSGRLATSNAAFSSSAFDEACVELNNVPLKSARSRRLEVLLDNSTTVGRGMYLAKQPLASEQASVLSIALSCVWAGYAEKVSVGPGRWM